ncbi:MAG: hypothetical protein RIQ52_165 [Pseudomonadota bacterium]
MNTENISMTTPIADAVRQYLDHDQWHYEVSERQGIVMFGASVTLPNGQFRCSFDADDDNERFGVYVYAPIFIPEDKRLAVAGYLTRVNYTRYLGKIEMDLDDGEIRSVATVVVDGSYLSQPMIESLETAAHFNLNDAYPGMLAVAFGDLSPEAAFDTYRQRDEKPSETEVEESA